MKRKSKKFKFKYSFLIAILVIAIFCFETVGYASFSRILTFNGTSSFKKVGKLEIIGINLVSTNYATENTPASYEGMNVEFDINFNGLRQNRPGQAVYDITVRNNSPFEYTYNGWDFNNYVLSPLNRGTGQFNASITGINNGDILEEDDEVTVRVTFNVTSNGNNFNSYNYTLSLNSVAETIKNPDGNIMGSFEVNEGNLRNNNIVPFTLSIMNTYESDKTFNLTSKSSKIELCDRNGNPLGDFNINGNETNDYTFYVKLKNNAILTSDTLSTSININYNDNKKVSIAGPITLLVNKNAQDEDSEPPKVSNINVIKNDTDGSLTLSWNGTDTSDIKKYYILVYKDNNLINTYNTNADETNYTINNLVPGNYSFKVYGEDASDYKNKPNDTQINNAPNDYVALYNQEYYQWYVNVSFDLDQVTVNPTDTKTKYKEDYVVRLTPGNNRTLNTPTVKIGGVTVTNNNQYTYNNNTITIKAEYVTQDITIQADSTGLCLVEGTKILLANGKYKNIENINYSDLLSVWSYDIGSIDYEYPIWIEKSNSVNSYQLTTFSDGSILKTVGYHGVFNKDLNRFVSVDNKSEFYIGANIIKIENNKLKTVKVTKIEYINEKVNYYHVVSSRYYNIIANDFLTTDGTVILSNLYGFDNNLKWINKNNNKYSYNDFKDIVPFYMFVGMRMEEAYNLIEYGLDLNSFKYYLKLNQLNDNILLKPKSKNNKYIFYVSTNTGIKSEIIESSYFRLPNTYKYWKNSVDNKIYNSNDLVRIDCSTHFIGYN